MRKLAIALALSTTVLAGPALARDGAWYVGGDFGAMIVEDTDLEFTPGTTAGTTGLANLGFNEGYDGALFAGYDFGAFRLEAEVSYKHADSDELTTVGLTPPGTTGASGIFQGGDGDISVLSGMINGLLDFGDDDGLSGFVGGGVGIARVDLGNVRAFTNTGDIVDGSDTRLAWQLVAGVRQALSRNVDIHLRYRFFNVDELEFTGFGGRAVRADLRTHSLLGGITFNFGAPVAPPPCLEPRYLNADGICVDRIPDPIQCGPNERLNPATGRCEAIIVTPPPCDPPAIRNPNTGVCEVQEVVIPPAIVYFGWDEDTLTAEARATLDGVIQNYQRGGRTQVVLAGHADRSGSATYNVGLSQRRANRVSAYLTAGGIPGTALTSQAFGESRPQIDTPDGVREPQNRRVEVTFGPGSGW